MLIPSVLLSNFSQKMRLLQNKNLDTQQMLQIHSLQSAISRASNQNDSSVDSNSNLAIKTLEQKYFYFIFTYYNNLQ